jgi:hypothetical protein
MTDLTPEELARRDAEHAAMIRRLRAEEQARRTGRTVEEVLAGWAAEDAARPTAEELLRRHDDATATARALADAVHGLRAASADTRAVGVLGARHRIAADMRGETIHYAETDEAGAVVRETGMQFFWTRGYEIVVDGMRAWWHPGTRTSTPMTLAERQAVVERVVAWARGTQGVELRVSGADW